MHTIPCTILLGCIREFLEMVMACSPEVQGMSLVWTIAWTVWRTRRVGTCSLSREDQK